MIKEQLHSYAKAYRGDWTKIAKAVKENEVWAKQESPYPYISCFDENYPECLKALRFPPWLLYLQGDSRLLNERKITIVGSRELGGYGALATLKLAEALSSKVVLVSGLARGADTLVHETAVKSGRTIAVIGNGIEVVYPKENKFLYQRIIQDHLLLSEYPPETPPLRQHFPWRNRILAALGDSLIVTQAEIKSGTMHTVNEALALSKPVYCVPYPMMDPLGAGCNQLIQEGANLIISPEELLLSLF